MASTDPDKRAKWVDELLERKEFSEIWVSKWAELLQVRTDPTENVSQKAMFLYYNWLVDKLSKNMPMDEMVQELLGASGGTFKNAATNFYQITNETLPLTENVAQVFMGIRVQCAQCHNHPFDRWTQNDYYSFAAFFAQIGRKQGEDYRETIVFNSGGGEVNHPVGGRRHAAQVPGRRGPRRRRQGPPRRAGQVAGLAPEPLVRHLVRQPRLGPLHGRRDRRAGRRLPGQQPGVEPRAARGPGQALHRHRSTTSRRWSATSATRGPTSARPSATRATTSDERNFAHALVRRIKAESLLDTISAVTDTKDKFDGLPLGARAVQIADGTRSTYFLTTFGRATRETACSCEVKMEPTLSQALHLLNGDTVNAKIQQGGLIPKLHDDQEVPRGADHRALHPLLLAQADQGGARQARAASSAQSTDQNQALEDMFWALLNSREFLFNH